MEFPPCQIGDLAPRLAGPWAIPKPWDCPKGGIELVTVPDLGGRRAPYQLCASHARMVRIIGGSAMPVAVPLTTSPV